MYGFDVACGIHVTEQERALANAYRLGWEKGLSSGHETGRSLAEQEIERLRRRIAELEQRLDDAERYYELDGDQVVEVGRYAYRWRGQPPLRVGERVVLPAASWVSRSGTFEGEVTKLGATYRGQLTAIIGRAKTDRP
ncbi:hypothetical protein ACFY19_18850 [Streptosporangium saharense]|uniref:hypothetical protein n=1 Tax=Streptosporangium saharense TaxID=1706840 RepID=UPI00367CEE96